MVKKVQLFVYGSFCQGMVHFDRLAKYVMDSSPARARGSAYRMEVGYPVFIAEGINYIEGDLVTLEAPDMFFHLLDQFHGFSPVSPEKSLFWRTEVSVEKPDQTQVEAQAYTLNPAKLPKSAELISEGDWRQSIVEKPVITEVLTKKQKEYIRKLGKSSARDIIPINIDLYRELLNLRIVEDKGRRLGLTKFGKEVYKYLPAN